MREIAVVSGKGGTGKTSIVSSLAEVSDTKLVLADCDVDAANLPLLLSGIDGPAEPFFAGETACVDDTLCTGCGACEDVCRFGAVRVTDAGTRIDSFHCEGCHACSLVCPEEAISFQEDQAGTLTVREGPYGTLVHAALGIARDNSGKLVAQVRKEARAVAEREARPVILIDGPPGIGCPVHAALSNVDHVLMVTEPSGSGLHDLERILDLCEHFSLGASCLVNKADLNPALAEEAMALVTRRGASCLGMLPFDPDVPRALSRGECPLSVPGFRDRIEEAWATLTR